MKKRNHAFDLLCGICIVRMISLHVMQYCGHASDEWWREVMQWSYFFMSFFFFKAGYFNKSVTNLSSKEYIKDKAKRLLIPYLTAGAIGDVIYFGFYPALVYRFHEFPVKLSWSHIWEGSDFYGNPPVWFLFSFFCSYVAIHFLERLRHRLFANRFSPRTTYWSSIFYIAFPALSYWMFTLDNPLWMSVNNVFMGIYFFELGRAWRRLLNIWSKNTTLMVSGVCCLIFVVGNIIWHDASYTMSSNTFSGNFLVTMINTTAILCGLSGLLIAGNVPRLPWICFIGEHSMVFFISHHPMIFFYRYAHLAFGRSIYGRWDDVMILLPALFMICAWLVPYIESVPILSGRWKKVEVKA